MRATLVVEARTIKENKLKEAEDLRAQLKEKEAVFTIAEGTIKTQSISPIFHEHVFMGWSAGKPFARHSHGPMHRL